MTSNVNDFTDTSIVIGQSKNPEVRSIIWHKSALETYKGLTDSEIRRKLKQRWYTHGEQDVIISFLHDYFEKE